jgi:hypothetical protein
MQITPGLTIEPGDTVTRQTIFDLWADAVGGNVQVSDLAEGMEGVFAQTAEPVLRPGRLWWDETQQLMKFYCDEVDGTGCSLWLAMGPDRFDVPLLAVEPIPFGACVQLTGEGRKAQLPPGPETSSTHKEWMWQVGRVVAFANSSPESQRNTTASGAWFAAAVDGLVWAWYPVGRQSGAGQAFLASAQGFDTLISSMTDAAGTGNLTGPSFVNAAGLRGGLCWRRGAGDIQADGEPHVAASLLQFDVFHSQHARVLFTGPRVMRITF